MRRFLLFNVHSLRYVRLSVSVSAESLLKLSVDFRFRPNVGQFGPVSVSAETIKVTFGRPLGRGLNPQGRGLNPQA